MGQNSSQPERGDAQDSSRARRGTGTLRRALTQSRQRPTHDGLQDGLLHETLPARSRPHTIRRFSQLFRPDDEWQPDLVNPEMEEIRADLAISPFPQRTRSRFQEMFRRGESSQNIRPSLFRRRSSSSYIRTSPEDDLFAPRLPSIDVTSTFDGDTFNVAPNPTEPPPRGEGTTRRTNLPRLNALRPDRPFRHLTNSLRRRRTPPASSISSFRPRGHEDQAAMLSRLLSVAAAATAATLMGDDHTALGEARSLSNSTGLGDLSASGEDGSFDGFLRALQNGRIASALRQSGSEGEGDGQVSQPGSLNFFRMFRFGASSDASTPPRSRVAGSSEASSSEGRMIPIIIVGIRSIAPSAGSAAGSATEDLPPFIDALGNFSAPLPAHALGTHGHDSIDSILRPPQNGTSFRHRRRASMGGLGMGRGSRLNDRMDDQRDQRSPERRRERPWSMASLSSTYEPRPPPATPASPSPELSRIQSRNTTPNHSRPASLVATSLRDFSDSRRNSVLHRASAASPLSSHREEAGSIHSTHSATNLLDHTERYRIHHRSDTAPSVHYPRFASGHPRRNGMVEPDHLPQLSRSSTSNATDVSGSNENRASAGDSRSWIIYVLGGSYPENHPIVTTPSLFTENPTYEDMMLLSSLLGPAKPPVASEEEVESAGGIYNITVSAMEIGEDADKTAATLVAIATDDSDRVILEPDQRCLVCLCDFEEKEIGRKLVKCSHFFHKECIDQWLTTGRNSCPLCREQGVNEKASKSGEAANDDEARPEQDAIAGAEIPVGTASS